MKKTLVMMSALALAMFGFSSCGDEKGPDVNNIIEDGYYVLGQAVGQTELDPAYMMTIASAENQNNQTAKRNGMYEKYITLKAGQEFQIVNYSAGEQIPIAAAKLEKKNPAGKDDQISVDYFIGKLVKGADAKKMKVEKDGLYHIFIDLNLKSDLKEAVVGIIPVEWSVRGVNGDWGCQAMTASKFNQKEMTFTIPFTNELKPGTFKFAHGKGWKLFLDEAGKVRLHTNLGKDMLPGGSDLNMLPYQKGAKIVLTWKLTAGAVAKGFEYKVEGKKTVIKPQDLVVGFSGDGTVSGWGDPSDNAKGVWNEAESKDVDVEGMSGTLVFDLPAFTIENGKMFKVRFNGGWISAADKHCKVSGIKYHDGGPNDHNFVADEGGQFKVKMTAVWENCLLKSIKVVFSK